jgi:hypothetical protein
LTISYNGDPSYVIQDIMVSTVLAAAYFQSTPTSQALAGGPIAGIVISVVVFLLIIAAFIWFAMRRRRSVRQRQQQEFDSGELPAYPGMVKGIPAQSTVVPTVGEDNVPVSPISSSGSGIPRKPAPVVTALSVDERAELEAFRAAKVRQQRASELAGGARGGNELGNEGQIHEIDGENTKELEGR